MKNQLVASLASLLASAGLALAEPPAPLPKADAPPTAAPPATKPPAAMPPAAILPAAPPIPGLDGCANDGYGKFAPGYDGDEGPRLWGSAEYLLYWVRSAPLPVPTLTTFAPNTPSATTGFGGALGERGTTVLSPDHFNYDPLSGGRLVLGAWLDNERQFGVEASGFLTQFQTKSWSVQSAANGDVPLRVPFNNVPPGAGFPLGESSFVLAEPGFANGGETLSSTLRLWGTDAHALWRVLDYSDVSVSLLGGIQYLDLQEGLVIGTRETLIGANATAPGSFGTYLTNDSFRTRNQFYGGQIGAKGEATFGRFFVGAVAELGLGDNHESVTINGSSVTMPPGKPSIFNNGGIFAQATNIGRITHDEFTVIPQLQLRAGAKVTNNLHVFVGYDWLYISDVVRPGDQIDRTLNFTANQGVNQSTKPLPLVGAPRPQPLFNHTDFWTQGITFGVEFRY